MTLLLTIAEHLGADSSLKAASGGERVAELILDSRHLERLGMVAEGARDALRYAYISGSLFEYYRAL